MAGGLKKEKLNKYTQSTYRDQINFNQGGLKIKSSKTEGPLHVQFPGF